MNTSEAGPIHVLYVSADEDGAATVASRLDDARSPLSVTPVASPRQALDRLAAVDCIVSELALPEMDGLSFLRAVRDRDDRLPFVLAPADGSESIASEAIAAGVSAYVPRPDGEIRPDRLAERIEAAVQRVGPTGRTAEIERIVAVIKDVNAALVHAETRTDLEQAVCEIFADSTPYQFAWVGEYDAAAHSLTPRASAGVGADFLERIPVGDGQTLPETGPGPKAIETRELQVTQNVSTDEAFDPYRAAVEQRNFRAVATVPITHGDRLYGLLAIYANRVGAFDAKERDLLTAVGDDMGHAIAAIETRTDLRRFRQAVDSAGQAIAVTGTDGTIEYVNSTFEAQTGYEMPAIVGRRLADVVDVSPEMVRSNGQAATDDMAWEREFVATTRDGDRYHAEQTITPILDGTGELDGFVLVQVDVSDRIEREAALRTETEMLESLFETSPIGIVVLSPDGTIRRANERASALLQIDAGSIVGKTHEAAAWTFVDEDGEPLPDDEHPFNRVRNRGESIYGDELRMDRPHADPIWLSIYGAPLRDSDGDLEGIVFTFDDVTEQKERQRELRSFEKAVEYAAHCIYVTDFDGTIEWVNPAFEDQTGYAREEAIGETPAILNSGTHEESFFEEMWATILSGEVWEREIVNERKDGTLVHVDQSIAPVIDDEGEIERFVAINQDITERKEYRLRLERQNERLEEFASVVSHDLRNPLNVVSGRLDLSPADDEHIEAAASALDRMEAIIEDVLTLARDGGSVEETEPVDLEAVARDAWRTVPEGDARLEVDDLPTVVADARRVRRILENLFRNAVEHGSTSPRLQAHEDAEERGSTSPHSRVREDPVEHGGEGVKITVGGLDDGFYVEDTGPGIPEEIRDRVFESGYTQSESGTGLGLAIVRQLAQAHGWTVSLTESRGGGARFEFTGVAVPAAARDS
ncbi:Signal transduction regulator [Halanaeroarchaeum sp. HSR-CO]|uniref:PAS domain S-box protein n=1 Tax=Halanaeroarchaeum sp. HSR-CO TaxID=2866382 RepID=UPI00217E0B1F|nr:PAS domain S-box protein [Halanaeroarchaeum sp. HSR-CO]UWG49063.1 Signal transduction regulator [Halanaeroarchaeum sp. HSR-CO]